MIGKKGVVIGKSVTLRTAHFTVDVREEFVQGVDVRSGWLKGGATTDRVGDLVRELEALVSELKRIR